MSTCNARKDYPEVPEVFRDLMGMESSVWVCAESPERSEAVGAKERAVARWMVGGLPGRSSDDRVRRLASKLAKLRAVVRECKTRTNP
jgi:hypothetical protein